MKHFSFILLIITISAIVSAQNEDAIVQKNETVTFAILNSFVISNTDYETFNNNFVSSSFITAIKSQSSPKIFIDGIPVNPIFANNLNYAEFLGNIHLLSYDLQNERVSTLQTNNRIENNEDLPILEEIENYSNDFTNANYIILKQIGLNYQLRDAKKNNYIVGLNYNKKIRPFLPTNKSTSTKLISEEMLFSIH